MTPDIRFTKRWTPVSNLPIEMAMPRKLWPRKQPSFQVAIPVHRLSCLIHEYCPMSCPMPCTSASNKRLPVTVLAFKYNPYRKEWGGVRISLGRTQHLTIWASMRSDHWQNGRAVGPDLFHTPRGLWDACMTHKPIPNKWDDSSLRDSAKQIAHHDVSVTYRSVSIMIAYTIMSNATTV